MTQTDIIRSGYRDSLPLLPPAQYSNYFNYRRGAMYAFDYVHRQFKELMEEWYGSEDFQDEKEEMTRLFEERIGIEN